ncbi:hypothetical protein QCA50_007426 [Cerrena zonata]|uniref:Uncharacterized protein n=1 Tax=Cerrena zonata TaxID=2478898 RepID=A0AAW0G7K0_9APHY
MLPLSQSFMHSGGTQPNIYSANNNLTFTDLTSTFASHFSDLSTLGSQDINSPETFKHNIILVLEQLTRVQTLARNTIVGIEHVYRPGTNSLHTSTDMIALRQAVDILQDMLRTSGVGALPLLNQQHPELPTEEQLLADTANVTQQLFDRLKGLQENSAIVTNLLAAEQLRR